MTNLQSTPFKRMVKPLSAVSLAAGLATFAQGAQAQDTQVDVELQLLLDVSGSISNSEYNLQMDGYAFSFRDQSVQDAILDQSGSSFGSIAVQTIMWSGPSQQSIGTDWTLLDSTSSINDYADTLENMTRPFGGTTYTAEALQFGITEFDNNSFDGTRQVIDISGDGYGYDYMYGNYSWFSGESTSTMRDNALAAGIDTINGITITHDYRAVGDQSLTEWYTNDVAGGVDSFVIEAASFQDFSSALTTKLTAEIEGGYIPEEAVASAVQTGPVHGAPGPGIGVLGAFIVIGAGLIKARRSVPKRRS